MILKDFARDVRRSAAKHLLFLIENKKQILRSARHDMLGGFYRGDLPRGLFLRILKDGGFSERDFIES